MEKNDKGLEKTILDWHTILGCFFKYWWVIIITTVLSMIIISVVSTMPSQTEVETTEGKEARYSGNALIYTGKQGEKSAIENSLVLLKSHLLLETVNQQLEEKGMPHLQKDETIEGSAIENADYLRIQIGGNDQDRVFLLTSLVADSFVLKATDILNLEYCTIINPAEVRENEIIETVLGHAGRLTEFNLFLILAFGMLTGVGILVAIMIFNDTIWNDQDIQRCFGDKFLGYFPKRNEGWQALFIHQCQKENISQLYVAFNEKSRKGKLFFEELKQLDKNISVQEIPKSEYDKDLKEIPALLVIERGHHTYSEVNKILAHLKMLDVKILGCMSV